MAEKKKRLEETPHDAIKHYEMAARENANDGDAHLNLATAYYAAHDYDNAEKHFAEAARLKDTLYHAHYYLGILAARRGNLDKARQALQRVANESNNFILKAQAATMLRSLDRKN